MKFRRKKNDNKALSLEQEDFAILEEFKNGRAVYEFTYSVNTKLALERDAQLVEIITEPIDLPNPPSIFSLNALNNKPSPVLIAKNIQQIDPVKKDVKDSNINARFVAAKSDFTTKISNAAIKKPKVIKKFGLVRASNAEAQSKTEPIHQVSTFQSKPVRSSFKSLSANSILKKKEDPSNLVSAFNIGAKKSLAGISSKAQKSKKLNTFIDNIVVKTLSKATVKTTKDAPPNVVVPIVIQDETDFVIVNKKLTYEPGILNSGEFLVKFNLMNRDGIIVETIKRKVNHAQNIRILQTPIMEPTITSITLPARNLLTIKQNDPNATSVDIFRKEIKRTKRLEDTKYVFVANVKVSKGNPVPFEDLIGNASNIIYRFIPKGPQGQVGNVYTNKVVGGYNFNIPRNRVERMLYAGIVAQPDLRGVLINVVGLAPGVAAIKLLAKDLTRNEKTYRIVPSLIENTLTTPTNDTADTYTFLDAAARDNNIIEYVLMLLYENGDEEISITREIYKNIPFSVGVVDTVVSHPRLATTNDGIDVQFEISSMINPSKIDTLKKLLKEQGQEDLYINELNNEKEQLNQLIAHQIRRIDLSTGQTVFFRTFTDKNFSDERYRKIDGIDPIKPGRVYRYIVSALLRTPETLFEKNIKTFTNAANVSVDTLPLKFKHPVVALKGNIVSPAVLAANYSEDPFVFGNVGNFVSQDITVDISKPKAFNAKVVKFNQKTNIVRWNVSGDKSLLDHFIVILDRLGDEEIIGKIHTNFKSNVIEYIDREAPTEPGSYKYKIIPVYKDYRQAPATITEEVI